MYSVGCYHILAPVVELIFFFFPVEKKNICLNVLQQNSHEDMKEERRGT